MKKLALIAILGVSASSSIFASTPTQNANPEAMKRAELQKQATPQDVVCNGGDSADAAKKDGAAAKKVKVQR